MDFRGELGAGLSLRQTRKGRQRRDLTIFGHTRLWAGGVPWTRCRRWLALALEVAILRAGGGGGGGQGGRSQTKRLYRRNCGCARIITRKTAEKIQG